MSSDVQTPVGSPTRTFNRGDIFWLAPDAASAHSHPHVVLEHDSANSTVTVCALTSNLHRAKEPGNVLLDVGEGNLTRHSVAVVSQVSSVDQARLGERIGALSEQRVDQILAGMRFLQATYFGPNRGG